jgi:exodeoxyribonuclease V gamma subunit
MSSAITPALIALHSNRLEKLRDVVVNFMREHPLGPLEEEVVLVQSNGVAEWLKIALASDLQVCAATRVMLPARFLWQAYRDMLGHAQVARHSPFDRTALTWRLMRLLPELVAGPGYAPLQRYLADDSPERLLQLCQRLSDLMDQYQVYRADWLQDWEGGQDVLRDQSGGAAQPLPPDQAWQARLWRAIRSSVAAENMDDARAAVHRRFVAALAADATPAQPLPRRVIVFGISSLPYQTLEAIAALSKHVQVIMAVHNPCQYHWADIIDGRELLQAKRRQQLKNGQSLADMPLEDMHAHSHPLLACWGRQGRDYIRLLDGFDEGEAARERFPVNKLSLFDDAPGDTLLQQVQAAIRDLLAPDEHPDEAPAVDASIEFQVAHSVQREVEILHDRLLTMLDEDKGALRPRDIVVMVPDIEVFAPAIHAVFGQHAPLHPRYIPYDVVDVAERRVNPLLMAIDWLMRLPQQRCLHSEILSLLDAPALAARFKLAEEDLPRVAQWIERSGIRWGLDEAHRDALGLGQAGGQNAWLFGIKRMLLGYACGSGDSYLDIEPFAEVGGLDAALAGSRACRIDTLRVWRERLAQPAKPDVWAARGRELMAAFFDIGSQRDRLTQATLEQALVAWQQHCAAAGFDGKLPFAVVREAWLGGVDEASLHQRFVSGGVTFCTLLPMRAVPFEVVCLLGMNDGDYPRRAQNADFDLLALASLARPGDRSRRQDDRYLMLEALLAARRTLYISWTGRNIRDNSEMPPSVLVAQLRDYLETSWKLDLKNLTTEHPMQPFSRRYFEEDGLTSHAVEWRQAHLEAGPAAVDALPAWTPEPGQRLSLGELAAFLKHPVAYFFSRRLQVGFDDIAAGGQDNEPFQLDSLEHYHAGRRLLEDRGPQESAEEAESAMAERAGRLAREGLLPLKEFGMHYQQELVTGFVPARLAWLDLCIRFPDPGKRIRVRLEHRGVMLEDWIDNVRRGDEGQVLVEQQFGRVLTAQKKNMVPRAEKILLAWLRQLASAAMQTAAAPALAGCLVGSDGMVEMAALDPETSRQTLEKLIECWLDGMARPLPVGSRTAMAYLQGGDKQESSARTAYDGGFNGPGEAGYQPCLARLWPDFDALQENPDWQACIERLYGDLYAWMCVPGQADVVVFDEMQEQESA